MKIDWNKLNPLPMFRETSFSLFSDGKISMKRVISFGTWGLIAWMIGRLLTKVIPIENHNLFIHCFDGLLLLIGTLLIGATWQDVAKNKAKSTVEQTTVENPPSTTTQTTITPPEQ